VPHGDHELRPEEQVQLAEFHDLHRVDVARRAENHESGVSIALELGALVGVNCVLDGKRVQGELFGDRGDLLGGRAEHPDPAEARTGARAVPQHLERVV
jgi:hypothetical protein